MGKRRRCNKKGQKVDSGLGKDPLLEEGKEIGEERVATSGKSSISEVKDEHEESSPAIVDTRDQPVPEEGIGQMTDPVNPLLCEDIVEYVLNHIVGQPGAPGMMSRDVQNIRLVSSLWQEVATRLYRRSPSPPDIIFGEWNNTDGGRVIAELENFLRAMKKTTMIPLQRFYIIGSQFYSDPCWGTLMKEFLQLCGPDATSLKLRSSNETALALNPDWCLPAELKLTKLRSLDLTYEYFPSFKIPCDPWDPATLGFADFIGALLPEAKNLQEFRIKLQLNFLFMEDDPRWGAITRRFAEIIFSRIPATVKNLSLEMTLSDLNLRDLAKLDLKLDKFRATTIPGSETARKFLDSQVETLQSLSIARWRLSDGECPATNLDELFDQLPWLKTNPKYNELLQRNILDMRPILNEEGIIVVDLD